MIPKSQVPRSISSTALGAAPGVLWFALAGTGQAALIAVLGGFIGFGLSVPGVSGARIAWGFAEFYFPWMRRDRETETLPDWYGYTAEDFPCPDPIPGRDRDYSTYKGEEVVFAVVAPKADTTAQEMRRIGLALQVWQAANGFVRRIEGLERMLAGQYPKTDGGILGLPMRYVEPPPGVSVDLWEAENSGLNESVALIYVDPSTVPLQAGEGLVHSLGEIVVSPAYYTHVSR